MKIIPSIQQLRELSTKGLAQQDNTIDNWQMHLYTSQDLNNLEMRIDNLDDLNLKRRITNLIAQARKQQNGNNEINKQKAKAFIQEIIALRKWKYVFVIAMFLIMGFIFGGLILARDTIEITGNIVANSNITSLEKLTVTNLLQAGNLSTIIIKTHRKSVTGLGCLGFGLITIITIWAFCCKYRQIQRDQAYYRSELKKIEEKLN